MNNVASTLDVSPEENAKNASRSAKATATFSESIKNDGTLETTLRGVNSKNGGTVQTFFVPCPRSLDRSNSGVASPAQPSVAQASISEKRSGSKDTETGEEQGLKKTSEDS